MDKQHLDTLLAAMRRELQELDGAEHARLKVMVDELAAEIEADDDHDGSLVERSRKRIEAFEVEHPTATGIANRVMQALADLGI